MREQAPRCSDDNVCTARDGLFPLREILAAADADKDRFKRELSAKLDAFIAGREKTA